MLLLTLMVAVVTQRSLLCSVPSSAVIGVKRSELIFSSVLGDCWSVLSSRFLSFVLFCEILNVFRKIVPTLGCVIAAQSAAVCVSLMGGIKNNKQGRIRSSVSSSFPSGGLMRNDGVFITVGNKYCCYSCCCCCSIARCA